LGTKRKIKLSDIDKAGKLEVFKTDLKKDIAALDLLLTNLDRFAKNIEAELQKPNNHKSNDDKLADLIAQILAKRERAENNGNPKVLIFTVYADTAKYLFEQLKKRGFSRIAYIEGNGWSTDDEADYRNFEPILERFAPYTKLFKEKEWNFEGNFEEWKKWIAETDSKTDEKLQKPLDILISTDVLSEGQNLQDCDMVINYDIHWNPVRVIQRLGRIDRLGSPNHSVFSINYWASDNINNYLQLQKRVENRMVTMRLAGAEVQKDFTDDFFEKQKDEKLEQIQKEKMLRQMETTLDDIETEKSFGFDDGSLEMFRQELLKWLEDREKEYRNMPKGVYTGFKIRDDDCQEEGMVALLKLKNTKADQDPYELVYLDKTGKILMQKRDEVLSFLNRHKEEKRFVPSDIEMGKKESLEVLQKSLFECITQLKTEKSNKGTNSRGLPDRNDDNLNRKYASENFELVAWFVVKNDKVIKR